MNDKTEKKTLVEQGTEFVGTMRATCPVVVRGKIEGDLEAPALSVTSTGSVSGNVKAKSVESQGVLAGSVEADDVSLAGEVRSDTVIRARSLEVKLAAEKGRLEVTFGECILDVGDVSTDHAAVDDASARAEASAPEAPATLAPVDEESSTDADGASKRSKKRGRADSPSGNGRDDARAEPDALAAAGAPSEADTLVAP